MHFLARVPEDLSAIEVISIIINLLPDLFMWNQNNLLWDIYQKTIWSMMQ